jgi:hypothetical protein
MTTPLAGFRNYSCVDDAYVEPRLLDQLDDKVKRHRQG